MGRVPIILVLSLISGCSGGSSGGGAVPVSASAGPPLSGGCPCESGVLFASDGEPGNRYGGSVSVDGNVMLVGASGAEQSTGAAYFLRFDGSSWVEEQEVVGSDVIPGSGQFGFRVHLQEDRALITSVQGSVPVGPGVVHLFRHDGVQWVEEQKLEGSPPSLGLFDLFGAGLALADDVILVGAPGEIDVEPGRVFFFRFNGVQWVEEEILSGAMNAGFGSSLAFDGETALVGVPGGGFVGDLPGSVQVVRHDGTSWDVVQVLEASDAAPEGRFGRSLALQGDTAVIGAGTEPDGAVYVFRHDGTEWVEVQKLTPEMGKERSFGAQVSIVGEHLLVTRPTESGGTLHVYRLEGQEYVPDKELSAGTPEQDFYGNVLAAAPGFAVLGFGGSSAEEGFVLPLLLHGEDCNQNEACDSVDVATGVSADDNANGIPDECELFRRGDANGDGRLVSVADAVFLLAFGNGGAEPPCLDAADFDDDGDVNPIVDSQAILAFVYSGGPPPPAPWPDCGLDATGSLLGCDTPTECP